MQSIERTAKEMENKIEFTDREKKILQAWELLTDGVIDIDLEHNRVDYGSKDRRRRRYTHFITNEQQKNEFINLLKYDIRVETFR